MLISKPVELTKSTLYHSVLNMNKGVQVDLDTKCTDDKPVAGLCLF